MLLGVTGDSLNGVTGLFGPPMSRRPFICRKAIDSGSLDQNALNMPIASLGHAALMF